jgi:hypothetical protein
MRPLWLEVPLRERHIRVKASTVAIGRTEFASLKYAPLLTFDLLQKGPIFTIVLFFRVKRNRFYALSSILPSLCHST